LPALADKKLTTVIDKTFPLDGAFDAQKYMESNSHLGKLVLQM
jgi:NADPH:quinone reductase-like Zn-dependent oxidoreductase